MKLTCLSKGGSHHFPACHILDLCGFRVLLECPLDLSALAAFSPITSVLDDNDPVGLIAAVPWYKAVRDLPDASLVDVVLVSSPMGILGLPFLTRHRRFSAKVYATEATARIGMMMMEELVSMHEEFVGVYGLEEDVGTPEWMKREELEKLPLGLREIVMGRNGEDLRAWLPLYSAADVSECMKKVQTLKYAEECCYNGALIFKPFSSGLEIGTSNWKICGPRRNVAYLSSSLFESFHATNFDYHDLQGIDVILFSDFSSLYGSYESCTKNEKCEDQIGSENKDLSVDCPDLREISNDGEEIAESPAASSEISDELEKIGFICSCVMDSVKDGGSVLIPIGRLGIILRLLEQISESLKSSDLKVPIYMISPVAEETLAFVNAVPEWLSEDYQQKLFSGEPLFSHAELIKEKKLYLFPVIHSSSLPMAWQEPCIVFSPHWSLRSGAVVHLLRLWHANKNCLLILEQGIDADVALSPFKPVAIKVLQCSFLSGIKVHKICPLLKALQPKLVLFPEEMKRLLPSKVTATSSYMYYTSTTTIHVPKFKEDFEAQMSTELAFQLQPRKLELHNIAIARLHGHLSLSNGKFFLVPTHKLSTIERRRIHWGSVDHKILLETLQAKGINASIHKDSDSTGCDVYHIHMNGAEAVAIQLSASETLITSAADETLTTNIYEAFDSASDGI